MKKHHFPPVQEEHKTEVSKRASPHWDEDHPPTVGAARSRSPRNTGKGFRPEEAPHEHRTINEAQVP